MLSIRFHIKQKNNKELGKKFSKPSKKIMKTLKDEKLNCVSLAIRIITCGIKWNKEIAKAQVIISLEIERKLIIAKWYADLTNGSLNHDPCKNT